MVEDFTEEDDEVLLDIYQELESLVYIMQAAKQRVLEYQIICPVSASALDTTKRAKPKIQISKAQHTKAMKAMPAVGKSSYPHTHTFHTHYA